MTIVAEVLGWLGALAVLAAYLLFSLGRISNGTAFQTANLIGSAALVINGFYHGAWPSVVTNSVWFAVAVATLVHLARKNEHQAAARERREDTLPCP